MIKCSYCAEEIQEGAKKCKFCGEWLDGRRTDPDKVIQNNTIVIVQNNKSKGVAALLAIFLGGIGIHKFYLNRAGWGIVYLLFCWTFIPAIIGFIEGLIYAFMSDEEFNDKYNINSVEVFNDEYNNDSVQVDLPKKKKLPDNLVNAKIIHSKVVTWSRTKLRTEPNATSLVIEYLPEGTKVDVIDQSGDWGQVIVPDKASHGWILTNSLDDLNEFKIDRNLP